MTTRSRSGTEQLLPSAERWELVSSLTELADLPLPEFCRELVRRCADSSEILACGLWRVDPAGPVALIVDGGLIGSPLMSERQLTVRHIEWLRQLIAHGSPQQKTWRTNADSVHGCLQSDGICVRLNSERSVVFETVRAGNPPADGFFEFLEEIARILQARWTQGIEADGGSGGLSQGDRQARSDRESATDAEPPEPRAPDQVDGQSAPTSTVAPSVEPNGHQSVTADQPAPERDVSVQPRATPAVDGGTPVDWQALLHLSMRLQRYLATRRVADVAANDGRLWLNCDRVTILAGKRPRLVAVSGVARWSRRSPWVRLVEQLCRSVAAAGRPLSFPVNHEELAPEIERPLAEYVAEAHPRTLLIVPLVVGDEPDRDHDERAPAARVVGCLVVEELTTGDTAPDLLRNACSLAECVARPLDTAQRCDAIPLFSVARAVGDACRRIQHRHLMWGLAATVLLALTSIGLVAVPWEHRVEADGQVFPSERRDVFAPLDSHVADILVEGGQQVTQGQLLVRLTNEELEAEIVGLQADLDEKRKLYRSLQFQIDQAQQAGQRDLELQLFGRLEETRALIGGVARKYDVARQRQDQLQVRAPISGTVATFQVDQLLRHRPVQRGDVLMTIMQESGPWQLELNIEESRLGHLIRAQQAGEASLPVEYVLVTAPEQHHAARLRDVATRATTSTDDRLVVRLIADPQGDNPDLRRIGAEVRARIACGPKALGYVLFGDVVEYVLRYIWW